MKYTKEELAEMAQEWAAIAKETLEIEQVDVALYAKCSSETGALRLFYYFRKKAADNEVIFSQNIGAWYFRTPTY